MLGIRQREGRTREWRKLPVWWEHWEDWALQHQQKAPLLLFHCGKKKREKRKKNSADALTENLL